MIASYVSSEQRAQSGRGVKRAGPKSAELLSCISVRIRAVCARKSLKVVFALLTVSLLFGQDSNVSASQTQSPGKITTQVGGGVMSRSLATAQASTSTTFSIWPNTAIPSQSFDLYTGVEIGEKFQLSEAGQIVGVRFYKNALNTGTHVGHLWNASGQMLGAVTFKNESASGWQTAMLASPIAVKANTVYVISYYSPTGNFSANANYLGNAYSSGPITLLSSSQSGGNGVFTAAGLGSFPDEEIGATNFWADIVFSTSGSSQPPPNPGPPPPPSPPSPPPPAPPPPPPPPSNPPPCKSPYTYPNTDQYPSPPPPCPPPLPPNPNPPGSNSQDDGPLHPCMEILYGVRLQSVEITGYTGMHSLNSTLYRGAGCNVNQAADQIFFGQQEPFYGTTIYGFLHFWDEPATSAIWTIDNFTSRCIDYSKVPDCN